jgi:A/G-specific adenine glycosylase
MKKDFITSWQTERDLISQLKKELDEHGLTPQAVSLFQKIIYNYYQDNGREFPWRETEDPYHILVSEIMLQQTQTKRVVKKYKQFLKEFPDFESLARASLREVLELWQGLGYNRRAKALKETAQQVVNEFDGKLPSSPDILIKLPGIGKYTAGAIAAFAFNRPTIFVETNIRAVFIHFFFNDKEDDVKDAEIFPLVEKALDTSNPRIWYYALMDYGVLLKKRYKNPTRKSAHYRKQSTFKGSNREIRGMILKILLDEKSLSELEIVQKLGMKPEKVKRNLKQLQKEGLVKKKEEEFSLP